MEVHEHETAVCPCCGSGLQYGVKSEPTCWKVHYLCTACGWETTAGRVNRASVNHRDELWSRAAELGDRWSDGGPLR